ncbi:hypothetical protein ACV1MK_06510 [Klebsiella michiganensis]
MTTDITELTQSMSIERIKQIALGGTPTVGEKERLAITALYFHHELKICTKAFQTAGLNQLAAEEALEKAQQDHRLHAARLLSEKALLKERIAELEGALEVSQGDLSDTEDAMHLWAERAKKAESNLESRTVKLPKLKMLEDYLAEVAVEERKSILVGVKLEFHRELTAAGIKWEAE